MSKDQEILEQTLPEVAKEENCPEGCRTPTSEDHKIPTIQTCPKAPRKPGQLSSRKRKLSELQFFEIVGREEVESFFRSSFDCFAGESRRVKKRKFSR
ncbi:hypothetical protein NMG60_11033284 [Bertholletia excelsa]